MQKIRSQLRKSNIGVEPENDRCSRLALSAKMKNRKEKHKWQKFENMKIVSLLAILLILPGIVFPQTPEYKYHSGAEIRYSHAIGMNSEISINGSQTKNIYSSTWESTHNFERAISSNTFQVRARDHTTSACGMPISPLSHDPQIRFIMDTKGNLVSYERIGEVWFDGNAILAPLPAITNLSFPIPENFNSSCSWIVNQMFSSPENTTASVEFKILETPTKLQRDPILVSLTISSPSAQEIKIKGHGTIVFSIAKGLILERTLIYRIYGEKTLNSGTETASFDNVFWLHTVLNSQNDF